MPTVASRVTPSLSGSPCGPSPYRAVDGARRSNLLRLDAGVALQRLDDDLPQRRYCAFPAERPHNQVRAHATRMPGIDLAVSRATLAERYTLGVSSTSVGGGLLRRGELSRSSRSSRQPAGRLPRRQRTPGCAQGGARVLMRRRR